MSAAVDSYKVSAKYYDEAYAAKKDLMDLPFYLGLAKLIGGPVLELACGTGRVLLPIAREGIAIHGVDNSVPMISALRKNLQREPKDVRELVSVVEGDVRTFRSNREYPLVIIPFRPLQHMYTLEDQIAAFKTAAFHLERDGILAFDVFFPKFDLIHAGMGQEILEMEWPVKSDPEKIVRRYFRKESVDKINQNFTATFVFRTFQGEKLVQEETEPLKMSYYTYPHLRSLFLLAGLHIVEEYGSFARTPLDNNAEQMIFLLKHQAGVSS
ncbi:MAG TPA: class I SAM-dependent methyltransferase [Candidatus Angelobacter sp.]|jgi:SAM-dependent methyltransferase|nr:class I SAM-dependent methyltransferase [Candidatus Angelobacter sp.]